MTAEACEMGLRFVIRTSFFRSRLAFLDLFIPQNSRLKSCSSRVRISVRYLSILGGVSTNGWPLEVMSPVSSPTRISQNNFIGMGKKTRNIFVLEHRGHIWPSSLRLVLTPSITLNIQHSRLVKTSYLRALFHVYFEPSHGSF